MSATAIFADFPPAILALANGAVFTGYSIGYAGETVGEVVFNTAMTGYQEILTDPSYAEQIVTLTYPHIGNVGINREDGESNQAWVKGLIVRDCSLPNNHWRSKQTLTDYLIQNKIVAIAGIDTRALTRVLRDAGAQNGCILTAENATSDDALAKAKAFPGLLGADLASLVGVKKNTEWTAGTFNLLTQQFYQSNNKYHVVVMDFGVKQNILRLLADRDCKITLVPATINAKEISALKPDGIVISNGPGDPAACTHAIAVIKELLVTDIPIFGICLGFQLLGLASGGKTMKMKFGHHGANHPVQNLITKKVYITSQNHGFTVNEQSLSSDWQLTHRSLFDGSLQGFQHKQKKIVAFQGHPEAGPGPTDIQDLFDQFVAWLK